MPEQVGVEKLKERCEKLDCSGRSYAFMYMLGAMEFRLKNEESRKKAEFFFEHLEQAITSAEEREKEKEPLETA